MVERFTVKGWNDDHIQYADPDGKWVHHSDYAELEAENERLRQAASDADIVSKHFQSERDHLQECLEDVLEQMALSRTGAVKVDRQRLNKEISKWATDSDLHITIGDVEALHLAILSALTTEPAAPFVDHPRETNDVVSHETPNPEDKPAASEGRQVVGDEPFEVLPDGSYQRRTRPAEQAVKEAMVEAAIAAIFHGHGWFPPPYAMRAALKAAMEAGR